MICASVAVRDPLGLPLPLAATLAQLTDSERKSSLFALLLILT